MNSDRFKTVVRCSMAMLTVLVVLVPEALAAAQVQINAGLATPVLLAGKKQTAFLKVGLVGVRPETDTKRVPVNIAIVLDRSGSMQGEKLEQAKRAAIIALERLDTDDTVAVITYDDKVNVLVPATKLRDREPVFAAIRGIRPGGSTALFAGVSKGANELRKFFAGDRVNRIVLLSDGLANVGPDSPAELGQLGASLLREGISISTIGLGLGYNEDLMTQLASRSGGTHYFAERATDLAGTFGKEFRRALSVVAQKVVVRINCSPGIRPVRVLNRDADISGQSITVSLDQLYDRSEKYLVAEVEVPAAAAGTAMKAASIEVTFRNMATESFDTLAESVSVRFTESKAQVEAKTDRDAMVAAVEQVATERSQAAMKLRDEGKIKEARDLLMTNDAFLATNAGVYKSEKLSIFRGQNLDNANNLDEEKWTKQRKQQVDWDLFRTKQ